MTADDCDHGSIRTMFAEGLPVMWVCATCSLRFYPACRTCVDVGHRNVGHPDGWIAGLATMDRPRRDSPEKTT